MKIVINLLSFRSENIAGVGFFMKRLFELLNGENTKGLSFCILCSPNINVKEVFSISDEINVEYKSFKYSKHIVLRILYEQIIVPFRLSKFDVYYSPTPVVPVFLHIINKKIKIIPTIHDLIPFYIKNKYGPLQSIYVRWITRRCVRHIHSLVTVSRNSREDIVNILGVERNKIKIVYNFIPKRQYFKNEIFKNYFVTVSTISPGRNISNLLKAFKLFREKYNKPDFKLYIIGKKKYGYEELLRQQAELGLQNGVIFTGYIPEDEKNSFIKESAAMLYLSFYEGFGIPPLEAMYWNKPSVVSNRSSLPEVVGGAGILCDPYNVEEIADSMMRIIIDREYYCALLPSQIGRFNPSEQVNKFLEVLKT
jgi:glycosyltransferase involved in cell wall biosynthesis